MSYIELFLAFLQVGLFSIGGGYAAIPLVQQQAVELHGWLTMTEFTDLITISEMTPGPIFVNSATFVGIRVGGIPGAIVATVAAVLPSVVIIGILSFVYFKYRHMSVLQSVLATLRPVVVALIASAGLSILITVIFAGQTAALNNVNILGILLFAGALIVLRKLKWNPIPVMFICGGISLLVGVIMKFMGAA